VVVVSRGCKERDECAVSLEGVLSPLRTRRAKVELLRFSPEELVGLLRLPDLKAQLARDNL